MIVIREVAPERRALRAFLELPAGIYRGDPRACVTAEGDVLEGLRRGASQGGQRILVADEDGRTVARVVARLSPGLRDADDQPVGTLGVFEALERPGAVGALLHAAVGWLREQGAGLVVGPMDGDTWHRYRFNVGPHELPPFHMEPYNPAYYAPLWKQNGFELFEGYHSQRVEDVPAVAEALRPALERAEQHGYRLRPLDLDRLEQELLVIHDLSGRMFAGNLLYADISRAEFLALYSGVRALLDRDLVWFAESSEGETVGFVFAFRDAFGAVQAMRGRRGPLAKLRFMLARGRNFAVNLKSLGVLAEHRRASVGGALMQRVYASAARRGIPSANLCLIRDGNPSERLSGGQGAVSRRYELLAAPAGCLS